MIMSSYWDGNGKYEAINKRLEKMVPTSGEVPLPEVNKALEHFRKASNAYYDIFNNGGCNRAAEIRKIFGVALSKFRTGPRGWLDFDAIKLKVDPVMDQIIIAAGIEQGIIEFKLKEE
jgi:hypothetical protein